MPRPKNILLRSAAVLAVGLGLLTDLRRWCECGDPATGLRH